jgi:hypothetical protein
MLAVQVFYQEHLISRILKIESHVISGDCPDSFTLVDMVVSDVSRSLPLDQQIHFKDDDFEIILYTFIGNIISFKKLQLFFPNENGRLSHSMVL